MGEQVSFTANGQKGDGWFAKPASGKGSAVVVIQEWWGLVPHIKDVTERFAREGFAALAPDLYHGKTTTSPDEAGRLLMELDTERAGTEIAGAGAWLLGRPETSSKSFGVVGFCMGGALAQYAATTDPKVGAAVSFYGGFKKTSLKWENLSGPILLIYGDKDGAANQTEAWGFYQKLTASPEKRYIIISDATHFFQYEFRREVLFREAQLFLEG